MKLIRNNVFETNSSSTHSLVLLKEKAELPKRMKKMNFQGKIIDKVTCDYPNIRIVCGTFRDGGEAGRIVPKFDNSKVEYLDRLIQNCPYFESETLTAIEENASYLFTYLQFSYYFDLEDEDKMRDSKLLLARFHELLLDLELHPIYQMPSITYVAYDYNYENQWKDDPKVKVAWDLNVSIEHNDGGFIEDLNDVREILKTKETLENYLTNYKIEMVYEG